MKKDQSKYHDMYHKAHRRSKRIFFVFILLLVVGVLTFFTFFNDGNLFTGRTVSSIDMDKAAKIRTSLSVPDLKLNGEYDEMVFVLKRGSVILFDGKNISLSNLNSEVVFKNFKGNFFFDENSINLFDGMVSEVIINGIPITSADKMKVFIESGAAYESIEIEKGVYLKNLNYLTSGEVSVDKSVLKPNNEKIIIKNYLGSLRILENKMILDGYTEYFELQGDSVKSVFSK